MSGRITEMSLTLDEEFMQSSSTFGGRVRLMGAPRDQDYLEGNHDSSIAFDAQIVEAIGLEMPEIIVFGGDLYGGGSKHTGTRMADREMDLTLLPVNGTSPSEVKGKLSALAGSSARTPLTLRITYETLNADIGAFEDGIGPITPGLINEPTVETWESKVYISNITSPIFSDSSEINVTLSMGDTLFTRSEMLPISGSVQDGEDKSGFSELRRTATIFATPTPTRIIYKSVLLSSSDLNAVGAPSPGSLEATITFNSDTKVYGLFVDDYSGGNIRHSTPDNMNAGTSVSVKYDPVKGRFTAENNEILRNFPATVSGKLPMFRPSRDSFRVGVEVGVNDRDVDIDIAKVLIAPGRYGF